MRCYGLRRNVAWLIAIRAVISTILLGSATVAADHRARVVRRRSVLLPDRPDLRADDRLRADAALRRAAPLAGRPAAGGRRADRLRVHLLHRRHHQLFHVALCAADHRGEHGPVPARRPAGGDAEHGALRRPRAWRSTWRRRACSPIRGWRPTRWRCRRRRWRGTPSP